jgi:SAM-dependent methyltransferase
MTDDSLRAGEYARKQLFGRGLIAWSHGRRFRMARRLAAPYAGARLLDYGCGDGTFLALVQDLFPERVGAEIDAALVDDARRRFPGGPRFLHTSELASLGAGSFGVVTCMEVLEHCTPEAVETVVADLRRLTAPGGVVLVSVPVETGPSLLVKQAARAVAGWRGVAGYADRERYTAAELGRMVFAPGGSRVERPVYETRFGDGTPNRFHGHKGFDWRRLAARLERDFHLREVRFSPLPAPFLASQVWMTCTPR